MKKIFKIDFKSNFKSIGFWVILIFSLLYGISNVLAVNEEGAEHVFIITGKGNTCLASIPRGYIMYVMILLILLTQTSHIDFSYAP